jgi:hypothetical protein
MTDDEAEAEIAAIAARYKQPGPRANAEPRPKSNMGFTCPALAPEVAAEIEAIERKMDRDFPGLREGKPVKPPPDNLLRFKAPDPDLK